MSTVKGPVVRLRLTVAHVKRLSQGLCLDDRRPGVGLGL